MFVCYVIDFNICIEPNKSSLDAMNDMVEKDGVDTMADRDVWKRNSYNRIGLERL